MAAGASPAESGVIPNARALARGLLPAPLYRIYRQRRIAASVASYSPRQVRHTYGGVALAVELTDDLAEGWYDHDWPALPEIERLRRYGLLPGARVFDIGAHQGIVALMLADAVGASGRIIAVEAEPHNARAAERNRVLNGADNVEVIHAAGAASVGSVLFAEGLNGRVQDGGSRWGKVEVPTVTVDHLARIYGTPALVMIDVEGFEGQVLEGASHTIAAGRSTFLVEMHVGHGLNRPVSQVIASFGSGYELLVAPTDRQTDEFEAYAEGTPAVDDRFFLIAAPTVSAGATS